MVELLEAAAFSIEQALSILAHHRTEAGVVEVAKRLATDMRQVAITIPDVRAQLCPGDSQWRVGEIGAHLKLSVTPPRG